MSSNNDDATNKENNDDDNNDNNSNNDGDSNHHHDQDSSVTLMNNAELEEDCSPSSSNNNNNHNNNDHDRNNVGSPTTPIRAIQDDQPYALSPLCLAGDDDHHPMLRMTGSFESPDPTGPGDDDIDNDYSISALVDQIVMGDVPQFATFEHEVGDDNSSNNDNAMATTTTAAVEYPFSHVEWLDFVTPLVQDYYNGRKSEQECLDIARLLMALIDEYCPEDMVDFVHFEAILTQQLLVGHAFVLPNENNFRNQNDIVIAEDDDDDDDDDTINTTQGVAATAEKEEASVLTPAEKKSSSNSNGERGKGTYKCGRCELLKAPKGGKKHICPERKQSSDGTEYRLVGFRDFISQTPENLLDDEQVDDRILYSRAIPPLPALLRVQQDSSTSLSGPNNNSNSDNNSIRDKSTDLLTQGHAPRSTTETDVAVLPPEGPPRDNSSEHQGPSEVTTIDESISTTIRMREGEGGNEPTEMSTTHTKLNGEVAHDQLQETQEADSDDDVEVYEV